MPQQSMWPSLVPAVGGLSIRLTLEPHVRPLRSVLALSVLDERGGVLDSAGLHWRGAEHDRLPETLMAACSAFLWGPDARSVITAARIELSEARELAATGRARHNDRLG